MLACAAAYQIVLDGTQSGAVKNGECAYVSAGIGRHTISFFNKGALNPKKPLSSFDFSVDTESDNIELEIETISLSAVVVARKKKTPGPGAAAPEGGRGAWSRRAPRFAGQRGSALF